MDKPTMVLAFARETEILHKRVIAARSHVLCATTFLNSTPQSASKLGNNDSSNGSIQTTSENTNSTSMNVLDQILEEPVNWDKNIDCKSNQREMSLWKRFKFGRKISDSKCNVTGKNVADVSDESKSKHNCLLESQQHSSAKQLEVNNGVTNLVV